MFGKLLNIDHHHHHHHRRLLRNVDKSWPDTCLTRLRKIINHHQNFAFDNATYCAIRHLPCIAIHKKSGLETIHEDICRASRQELECRYRLLERDYKTLSVKCNNEQRARLSAKARSFGHLIEKNDKLTNKLETLDHLLRRLQRLNRRLENELDECRDKNELLHFRLVELENDARLVEKVNITYEKATMVDEEDAGFFGSSEDDDDCSTKYCFRM
uniref:Uncharacterized protein n=1 Tax=Romanomermis culicivorax TaxID=13658 RepID=A0A915HWR1_ROMCU